METEAILSLAIEIADALDAANSEGIELDGHTDIFSFGLVLYEMSTGKQTFSGNTSAEIYDAILNRTPVGRCA